MPDVPLIAIVDDDLSVRTATQDLLDAAGFPAVAFESAEAFLASDLRASICCLVADMKMSGMTGLELHQHLADTGRGIPTVIITSHWDRATEVRARDAGITCHLSKPFTSDELLKCVRNAVLKSQSRTV